MLISKECLDFADATMAEARALPGVPAEEAPHIFLEEVADFVFVIEIGVVHGWVAIDDYHRVEIVGIFGVGKRE